MSFHALEQTSQCNFNAALNAYLRVIQLVQPNNAYNADERELNQLFYSESSPEAIL